MGEWCGPDDTELYELAGLFEVEPGLFVRTLINSGLVVRSAYYVPDTRELADLMKGWQYHAHRGGLGARWVMCRETVQALARRYEDKITPAPMVFDADWWRVGGLGLPSAALELEVMRIIEFNQRWTDRTMLFGKPIRLDPAARSPLFEIDAPATWERS